MRMMKLTLLITFYFPAIAANEWRHHSSLNLSSTSSANKFLNPRGGDEKIVGHEISDLELPQLLRIEQKPHSHQEQLSQSKEGKSSSDTHDSHSTSSPSDFFHLHPMHKNRNEEKAVLGRAVLTTPHRRMPAIRIAPGPRSPFLSEFTNIFSTYYICFYE